MLGVSQISRNVISFFFLTVKSEMSGVSSSPLYDLTATNGTVRRSKGQIGFFKPINADTEVKIWVFSVQLWTVTLAFIEPLWTFAIQIFTHFHRWQCSIILMSIFVSLWCDFHLISTKDLSNLPVHLDSSVVKVNKYSLKSTSSTN